MDQKRTMNPRQVWEYFFEMEEDGINSRKEGFHLRRKICNPTGVMGATPVTKMSRHPLPM